MKIVAIQASPNQDGLTFQTANSVLKGVKSKGHVTELIHLNERLIKKCKACENGWGECLRTGTCILVDDFKTIRNTLYEADAIIFATPVYWHDLSESAKSFLDRLRRVERHNNFQRYSGKKAIGIASAGGSGNGAARALYLLEEYLKRIGFKIYDLVTVTQKNKGHKIPMLKKAGERIFSE